MFYIGAAAVIAVMVAVSVLAGKKMKNGDFSGEHSGGSAVVAGMIIGTIVGGSSTIGTAQLAFTNGFSAWWYTLGAGLGVLFLGLVFLRPVYRRQGVHTVPDMVAAEYGKGSGVLVAVMSSVGTFLSLVAQIVSGCALMEEFFGLSSLLSVTVMFLLIVLYVLFGGAKALGRAGTAKTVILGACILLCGVLALFFAPGTRLASGLSLFPREKYFNLFSRGIAKDGGSGLSLLVGVVTTQSYFTAVLMGRSEKTARRGTVAAAVAIPLFGLLAMAVGMYMKLNYPDIETRLALPMFIRGNMPPFLSGVMMAALLVTVVGTGAGLAHGIATMLNRNIFSLIPAREGKKSHELTVSRLTIVAVTLAAALVCLFNLGSLILDWSFLSMGLRGAAGFFPLVCALFFPGKVDRRAVLFSMPLAVACTVAGKFLLPPEIDPLFAGMAASLLAILAGWLIAGAKRKKQASAK